LIEKESSSLLEELEEIAEIKITSPTEYHFRGKSYNVFGAGESNAQRPQTVANYFTASLGALFYSVYHCRQGVVYASTDAARTFQNYHDDAKGFIESLSQANNGKGTRESGWEIRKIETNGLFVVHKNGLNIWVLPQLFVAENSKSEIGSKGSIPIGKEFRALLPGFYMVNSNATVDDNVAKTTVRIYWNIGKSSAVALMTHVTTELNKDNVPFRFKTVSYPNLYARADAAVLYVDKRHLVRSKLALSRIYRQMKSSSFKPQTPLLARRLAPGIALAEDPNNGESFGQHRSRLLAEALYAAYEKGGSSTAQKIAEIEAHFRSSGLNLLTAYLNPGSLDDYDTILKGIFD
jgi:hypothetical protein